MNLYDELKNYTPFDEAEKQSLNSMLYFIKTFDDNIWTRDNIIGHVCASAWVINKEKTKVLMAYHNIYQSYAWLGGHADGNKNLAEQAKQEAFEESGIKTLTPLNDGKIIDINMQCVIPHQKRGTEIPAHLHLTAVYAFEGDEKEELSIKADENSAVKWLDIDKLSDFIKEDHMFPIYNRIIKKLSKK